ncbi:mannitol-1-phosphate 5-dehydrogenase [Paenibacillus marinisediminis]
MRALHFGAGNIGRGFIGLLLNRAGFDVCFADVNKEVIDELNSRGEYSVGIADESQQVLQVSGVRGVLSTDEAVMIREIAAADLVTTAVGPNVLRLIAPTIAAGIRARREAGVETPLHMIACENMVGGSTILQGHVREHLDAETIQWAEQRVSFPDSAVDRIVPNQHHEDKLRVDVEPFYEWVIDETKLIGDYLPRIEGATYVKDLTPFIERKLFTVNTGHAISAYLGYQAGYTTIEQAVKDEDIRTKARRALGETGALLVAKYDLDPEEHNRYIEKILSRFTNKYLEDQVTRIGRSPLRKLGRQDRFVSPAVQAFERGLSTDYLCEGMAAAFAFDCKDDEDAVRIQAMLKEQGIEATIVEVTGLEASHPLVADVADRYRAMQGE